MMPQTKAYLRGRYRRLLVDDPRFVRGRKGRYTVGQGFFARGKRAVDTYTGTRVVIKCQRNLPPAVSEAVIHAALRSERVIALLDTAVGPRKRYMVLEEGVPIDLKRITEAGALDLMHQLVEVTRELRRMDAYHGDLAVRNLYVAQGILRISDFNFAAIHPGPALRPLYDLIEAIQFCETCVHLLKSAGSPRAEAFAHWYKRLHTLEMPRVAACPWLCGQPDADLVALAEPMRPGVHALRWSMARIAVGILPLRLGPPKVKSAPLPEI